MKTHGIKIQREYYLQYLNGMKPFEIRFNDRDYKQGETVCMSVYDGEIKCPLDTHVLATIGFVTSFQQKKGWVVFGLLNITPLTNPDDLGKGGKV